MILEGDNPGSFAGICTTLFSGRPITLIELPHAAVTRGAVPREFKDRLIEMVRAGRKPEEFAERFEPTAQSIRNWLAQADRDNGRRSDGLTTDEREELRRLAKSERS